MSEIKYVCMSIGENDIMLVDTSHGLACNYKNNLKW